MRTIKYPVKKYCFLNAYQGEGDGKVSVHSTETGDLLLRVAREDIISLASGSGSRYTEQTEEQYRRVVIEYIDKTEEA